MAETVARLIERWGIHPDMAPMMEALERIPASNTVEREREAWSAFCRETNRPRPEGMTVADAAAPGEGWDIPLRAYRPAAAAAVSPAILYIHGGGFMVGDLDTNDTVAWGLAEGTGTVVVGAHYRLAPENPFPAAHDDCYAALRHIHERAGSFGIDPDRIAICGDSAGGNLAATVALAARDRHGPPLCAQALLYPGLRTDGTLPSFTAYGEAPLQSAAATAKYRRNYMPDPATHTDPYACPLMASDYGGLPPALVHVAAIDAARDEGMVYAERMAEAGVDVAYRVAEGMIHGFLRARFDGPAAEAEFDAVTAFLAKRLFA